MTKGDNDVDVDDVGTVPECTEVEKQRNLYSTPFQTEPVYESPFTPTMVDQQRESEQRQGRRSKTNDIYESTNDETLPNGRSHTGYSYCRNTDVVSLRSSQQPCLTYDNLVSATEGEHEYVESFRNSHSSKNAIYSDSTQASEKALTIEGVRDTKAGAPKRYPHGNHGQQRATCIQVFTLLLSIMSFLIGTFALLVALRTIKLNDIKKNESPTGQQTGSNQESGPGQGSSNESSTEHESYKYKELLDKMESCVASSEKNYTNLMEQYNQIKKQVASSEQNYNTLTAKYNEVIKQIKKVSEHMGHRGFNGSQGLQGPQGAQGVGNLSACIVKELMNKMTLGSSPNSQSTQVSYQQPSDKKIISAVCATKERAGAIQTVLSRDGDKYTCTCAGKSTYSSFEPTFDRLKNKFIKCVIILWECPKLT